MINLGDDDDILYTQSKKKKGANGKSPKKGNLTNRKGKHKIEIEEQEGEEANNIIDPNCTDYDEYSPGSSPRNTNQHSVMKPQISSGIKKHLSKIIEGDEDGGNTRAHILSNDDDN